MGLRKSRLADVSTAWLPGFELPGANSPFIFGAQEAANDPIIGAVVASIVMDTGAGTTYDCSAHTSSEVIHDRLQMPDMNGLDAMTMSLEGATAFVKPQAAPADFTDLGDENIVGLGFGIVSGAKHRFSANMAALKVISALKAESRNASDEEKSILARYSGWGGLGDHIYQADTYQEIVNMVGVDQATGIKEGILDAHYTPPEVIQMMGQALSQLGFSGGKILDPCMGTGNFYRHLKQTWLASSVRVGCEIDEVSAMIVKELMPSVAVQSKAFQLANYADNDFDLVVSNVPFGEHKVYDPENPSAKHSVHNFFFEKALRKVRPGGLVAFITSRHTMDSATKSHREMWALNAHLVAALRLPMNAFKEAASTEVCSDVLIFQKKTSSSEATIGIETNQWLEAYFQSGAGSVSKYFEFQSSAFKPYRTMVRGQFGNYWGARVEKQDWQKYFAAFLSRDVPRNTYQPRLIQNQDVTKPISMTIPEHLTSMKVGAWVVMDGKLFERADLNSLRVLAFDGLRAERGVQYVQLRDTLLDLLKLQVTVHADAPVDVQRTKLNTQYEGFVRTFKAVNSKANRQQLRSEPYWPLVAALEFWDEDLKQADKAMILHGRTNRPFSPPTKAANAKEAMLASLNLYGKLVPDYMSEILSVDSVQVIAQLVASELVYLNPESKEWEPAQAYLSGNILQKMAQCESAMASDKRLERNFFALEKVMPKPLEADEIHMTLGATFIDVEAIRDFWAHLLGVEGSEAISYLEVRHGRTSGKWKLMSSRDYDYSHQATVVWGTTRVALRDLLMFALNQGTPTVYDETAEGKQVANQEETLAAREKLDAIRSEFGQWFFKQEKHLERAVNAYNLAFNVTVLPVYDGSHLSLPGLNPMLTLRPHQKNAIWQGLMGGNFLVAHAVGAGKTLVDICLAMESKRMGLVQSSMLVVPSHVIEQFVTQFLNAYPTANVLVLRREDMGDKLKRRSLLAQASVGGFDAVIVGHSTFGKIPADAKLIDSVYGSLRDEAIAETFELGNDKSAQRKLIQSMKRLDAIFEKVKAEAIAEDVITLDMLGVGQIIVDESQAFKNLWFTTSMTNVAGLAHGFSRRAFDLYVKGRGLQIKNDERRGLVFSTGTPIANTIAEMFHLMRYMIYPRLKELGIHRFDAWAANFGEVINNLEVMPEGSGFRVQQRFARYKNWPELLTLFHSFADVQLKEDLNLPTPAIEGGRPDVVTAQPSAEVKAYIQDLARRAEKIRSSSRPDPSVDNMLKVTSDGRKAALDMRLIDSSYEDHPNSKFNLAVNDIFKTWDETQKDRLTQLVFLDIGTPGGSTFCLYDDMKSKLMSRGIPAQEIAFIHDAKTDGSKLALYARVNRGDVRILIGSTQKMGTGTNVQRLLYRLHQVDAPWRPDEVEQRDGRADRQGNLNTSIRLTRYVTAESFDAYVWQTLETKMRFISQALSKKISTRTIEDIEMRAFTYAEVKAMATGNPLIMERAAKQQEVAKLEGKWRSFQRGTLETTRRLKQAQFALERERTILANIHADIETVAKASVSGHSLVVGQRLFPAGSEVFKAEAAQELDAALQQARLFSLIGDKCQIGYYGGLELIVEDKHIMRLCGLSTRSFKVIGNSASGNFTKLRNLMEELLEAPSLIEKSIAQLEQEIAGASRFEALEFPEEQQLKNAYRELEAVEAKLGIDKLGDKLSMAAVTVTAANDDHMDDERKVA